MSLEIAKREVEGIVILELIGRLVAGGTAALQTEATALLRQGSKQVILDFTSVPFIDSSGLGILVAIHSEFQNADGAAKLLHLSKRNLQLLVLTKLSIVFEIYDDQRAAIDSFFPDRVRNTFDILDFVRSQESEPGN
jgi:anti-sigma B factor antagonist